MEATINPNIFHYCRERGTNARHYDWDIMVPRSLKVLQSCYMVLPLFKPIILLCMQYITGNNDGPNIRYVKQL